MSLVPSRVRALTAGSAVAWLSPIVAALAGLALAVRAAPDLLGRLGFPLDDAWIHAVYARELARSGMLAYNAGVPATGETSPLWALVLTPLHAVAPDVETVVLGTKLIGFAMHLVGAAWLAKTASRVGGVSVWLAGGAGALLAIHPDLLASSMSGMEVPLAVTVVAGGVAAATRGRTVAVACAGALALLARPEAVVAVVVIALLVGPSREGRALITRGGIAALGAVAALAVMGMRNVAVSGVPLPATFYAKASHSPFEVESQVRGFGTLLGGMLLLHPILVGLAVALAFAALLGRSSRPAHRMAAALALAGTAFCAVSFALVRPVDPHAFYHQRYALPGAALILFALPILVHAVLAPLGRRLATGLAVASVVVALTVAAAGVPARAARLANDARNIDDVQVAFGRALGEEPAARTAWVVDAGASRYFGRPFVVDLMGLNTPEMLDSPQRYLDAHPPSYLDVFPGWSRVEGEAADSGAPITFATTTPYTVTSDPRMRQHSLLRCGPPGSEGRMVVRNRDWPFRCAG
ncbi:MAG: hypothetical protein ABL971_12585 [Vicinamibacterales bacterium]